MLCLPTSIYSQTNIYICVGAEGAKDKPAADGKAPAPKVDEAKPAAASGTLNMDDSSEEVFIMINSYRY